MSQKILDWDSNDCRDILKKQFSTYLVTLSQAFLEQKPYLDGHKRHVELLVSLDVVYYGSRLC